MGRPGIITQGAIALPELDLLARIFRTFGDATRLGIIEALLEMGEASQTQIIKACGLTQSRASEHLATLDWCGVVESWRAGRAMRYRLSTEHPEAFLRLARSFLYDYDDAVGGCTVLVDLDDPVAASRY